MPLHNQDCKQWTRGRRQGRGFEMLSTSLSLASDGLARPNHRLGLRYPALLSKDIEYSVHADKDWGIV